jgi:recombination protein RecA
MAKKSVTSRVELDVENKRDDLANDLADVLNKSSKDLGNIAFFLDQHEDPSQIVDWISTGSSLLDLAISNRPHGGVPCGRITEITGLESSGKSLLSAHILAETQKKGGIAVFIDTETSVSEDFLRSIGVDIKSMVYVNLDTVEDIFDSIENIVANVRKSNKDRLVTIVTDSVAAASTKSEMESKHGQDGYATGKAIAISKAMRKITNMIARQRVALVFTNQLRQKMNAMPFSDPWTTSGGKALAFHSSVRLRLASAGSLKKKTTFGNEVIGIKCKAKVVKNRMGPPMKNAEFDIFFNRGIDDASSWLTVLKTAGIISGTSSLKYTDIAGKTWEFSTKEFVDVLTNNPDLKEELYLKICDLFIMKYKGPNAAIEEDVELSTDAEDAVDSD